MIALGLIETQGYVAAIAATDAMLKAANVYVIERSMAGCGLVTISIASKDVSSVQAAVEAGAMQVLTMGGTLISKHVIARPYEELQNVINLTQEAAQAAPVENNDLCNCGVKTVSVSPLTIKPIEKAEETIVLEVIEEKIETKSEKIEVIEVTEAVEAIEPSKEETVTEELQNLNSNEIDTKEIKYSLSQLRSMTLGKLRELARSIENFPMSKDIIAKANKNSLIAAINKFYS